MKIKHVLIAVAAVFICGFGVTGCADFNNSDFGTSHYEFYKTNKNKITEFAGEGWYYIISGNWTTDEEFFEKNERGSYNIQGNFLLFDKYGYVIYSSSLWTPKETEPYFWSGEKVTYEMYVERTKDAEVMADFGNFYFGKITPEFYEKNKNYLPFDYLGNTDLLLPEYNFLEQYDISTYPPKEFPGEGWYCFVPNSNYRYYSDGSIANKHFRFIYVDSELNPKKWCSLHFEIYDYEESAGYTYETLISEETLKTVRENYRAWCYIDEAFFNAHSDILRNLY